jgi:hypothetical protein
MSKVDEILYVVAPIIGVIGFHERKGDHYIDQDPAGHAPLRTADELMNDFSNDERTQTTGTTIKWSE